MSNAFAAPTLPRGVRARFRFRHAGEKGRRARRTEGGEAECHEDGQGGARGDRAGLRAAESGLRSADCQPGGAELQEERDQDEADAPGNAKPAVLSGGIGKDPADHGIEKGSRAEVRGADEGEKDRGHQEARRELEGQEGGRRGHEGAHQQGAVGGSRIGKPGDEDRSDDPGERVDAQERADA